MDYQFQFNDKIYLFGCFPYDYSKIPPFEIANGILLAFRPERSMIYSHEIYQGQKKLKPYEYILPSINITNPPKVCICISDRIDNRDQIFWNLILAMRLIKNLEINVSGSFIYTKEDFCAQPSLYHITTQYNIVNDFYKIDDFEIAAELLKKLTLLKDKFPQIWSYVVLFAQVAIGRSTSYQMMLLALWSCLDGLLGSSAKAEKISEAWHCFFYDAITNSDDVSAFIKNAYSKRRNLISHGNYQFWNYDAINHDIEFVVLYEIVKITLLGFLGLTYEELLEISQASTKGMQSAIKENKASRYYLDKLNINYIDLKGVIATAKIK